MPHSRPAADDIRAYLIGQLNLALRRPGMFGNEGALRMLVDHLLFVEAQPEALAEQQKVWKERGAWTSAGVTGAFQGFVPGRCDDGMASVYAEFARRRGWLRPDRVLAAGEYGSLRSRVRSWAGQDRVWADVVDEFGAPSVLFGGTNPLYGKTLGYVSEDPEQPMVSFHLWNGSTQDAGSSRVPQYPEAVLLAVRIGDGHGERDLDGGGGEGGDFGDWGTTLTLTPEGERQRRELLEAGGF
ncbi:hypothetical protein GCM10010277_88060 [Streptomyces longisporoflavus]|uniref:hypothetical protein n=1 Tax=Streptomyces longisporoflavus TaxID=28044 RepID=UPI00167F02CA|nr:hypothetical protein [Streptomyces longisporoflavus]GGV74093.1 hypothetical protein GCM10010277_88060 [Streptomyces longisporoflavus]